MCMTKDTVIIGYSGFAKEIRWLLERVNQNSFSYNFLGFIDKIPDENVIGDDRWLCGYPKPVHVIVAIGNGDIRRKLVSKYRKNPNIIFPNIIDPSVKYEKSLELGEGNIICANNIITTDVKMGSFDIINLNSTIGHGCTMGDFVTVNPGCNISGNVSIGSKCLIGTGSTILQGKSIGAEAIIGAGAVVTKDINSGTMNIGIPAKEVKK